MLFGIPFSPSKHAGSLGEKEKREGITIIMQL